LFIVELVVVWQFDPKKMKNCVVLRPPRFTGKYDIMSKHRDLKIIFKKKML